MIFLCFLLACLVSWLNAIGDGLFRSAAILFDSNYFSMLYFCCRRSVPASDVEAEARYISHTGGCIIRRVCRRLFFCPECSICRRERAFRQRPERSLRSKSLLSTPATSSSGATEPADPSVIQRKQAKQRRRERTSRRRFSSFAERKRPSPMALSQLTKQASWKQRKINASSFCSV